MKWEKKGVIYCPRGENEWKNNSFMTPTPFLLTDNTIRVFGAFRDKNGVGRIGYVDVSADNPCKVITVSSSPVLGIGEPGAFDDNGVILGDVIKVGSELYMYYVGFQLAQKVKFFAFSGLAISKDNGNTFYRYSKCPIMDRTGNALHIRAIHSVIVENNLFKVWYAVGNGWEMINNIPYPKYDIKYTESHDGVHFDNGYEVHCLNVEIDEYRIGRPRVRKVFNQYEMMFTSDTLRKDYRISSAVSKDGKEWVRSDIVPIDVSLTGWDSEMVCYPACISVKDKTYMFYNGNNMGLSGFGYAELLSD
ncbi:MAG: hypothetical protein LBT43_21730 [Prevotella sp.]|jgi:predicted GH43/DUF377 family glycosyl hydrolase|nr:hypothetical protein [Prevotella sp.]